MAPVISATSKIIRKNSSSTPSMTAILSILLLLCLPTAHARAAFVHSSLTIRRWDAANVHTRVQSTSSPISSSSSSSATSKGTEHPFLDIQLRGAAMRLHTRSQAPREGQAPERQETKEPHVPTRMDYLQFLVDSQCVYNAMETIVKLPHLQSQLESFLSTGLERVQPLEEDIHYMMDTYQLTRPAVGHAGKAYASFLMDLVSNPNSQPMAVPRFICHYYNYYFAHTAGGRMVCIVFIFLISFFHLKIVFITMGSCFCRLVNKCRLFC